MAIVALLGNGRTEVFWGHCKSLAEAKRKRAATIEAAAQRLWQSYAFEIAELVRHDQPTPPAQR